MPSETTPEVAPLELPFAPRQVLLFSGHMVDAPERLEPRFPSEKVGDASRRLRRALADLDAGEGDIALCQAAAGGDLLFGTACLDRGVHLRVLLPFEEPEFIERSILPSEDGELWRERYFAMKARSPAPPIVMSRELGPAPDGVNPFERCNLWLLNTALALGGSKLRLICLWDGGGGDGAGGTAHMVAEVQHRGGAVTWIDTRTLQEER